MFSPKSKQAGRYFAMLAALTALMVGLGASQAFAFSVTDDTPSSGTVIEATAEFEDLSPNTDYFVANCDEDEFDIEEPESVWCDWEHVAEGSIAEGETNSNGELTLPIRVFDEFEGEHHPGSATKPVGCKATGGTTSCAVYFFPVDHISEYGWIEIEFAP